MPNRAEKIIALLNGRGGFEHWWGDIDEDTKREIIEEIDGVINEA